MSPKLLTSAEVASLIGRLESRPCSVRQVRYLLLTGQLGSDLEPRTQGQTRLHGVFDVALVRLAVRMAKQGLSTAAIRVVLTYLRSDVIRSWKAGAPLALAVKGLKGSLEPALKGRPSWATGWVPLRDVWNGLDSHIQQVSDARSAVWMWCRVPVNAVRTR